MKINQILIVALILLIILGGSIAIYGLRYTPVGVGDGLERPVLVWDRWKHEVCEVSLMNFYPVHCGKSNPYRRR
jgi:hypothetical protein